MDIKVNFLDGGSKTFKNVGYSVFKGKLYLWRPGTRKGKTPRATYNLSKLHSMKKTGKKGWEEV